jgi:D-threo-aldose 1-dehydrogenase
MVSVHDPDEYLAGAQGTADRKRRFNDVIEAYRALFELKRGGKVTAVGIGSKDWRVIREIGDQVALDWVMFACSLTVYTHSPDLLEFIDSLRARGIGMINSAVFHAGFLTGGEWFDYRKPDLAREGALFAWRERFFSVCRRFDVKPAHACVQFGQSVPGIVATALNTAKHQRI